MHEGDALQVNSVRVLKRKDGVKDDMYNDVSHRSSRSVTGVKKT